MKRILILAGVVLLAFSACDWWGEEELAEEVEVVAEVEAKVSTDVLENIDAKLAELSVATDAEKRDELVEEIAAELVLIEDDSAREKVKGEVVDVLAEIRDGVFSGEIKLREKNFDIVNDAGEELDALFEGVVAGISDEEMAALSADLAAEMVGFEDEELKEQFSEIGSEKIAEMMSAVDEGRPIDLSDLGFESAGECLLTEALAKKYCSVSSVTLDDTSVIGVCSLGLDSYFSMPAISMTTEVWSEEKWNAIVDPPIGILNDKWDVSGLGEEAVGVDTSMFEVEGQQLTEGDLFRQESLYVKKDGLLFSFFPRVMGGEGCSFEQAVELAKQLL